jgi:glutamate racemase
MNNYPIGVLDSGVGGLTVLQSIVHELPDESVLYIGDSKNTPYGAKPPEEIYRLSKRLIEFLLQNKVKIIVIGCNTITVSCLDRLRSEYPNVPIIGTVPVIKTAAAVSKNRRIGILSTTVTAQSDYQKHLIEEFASDCTVFNHGTDALVPLIEQGKIESSEMADSLNEVLKQFSSERIDALALGCTHFPFLIEKIRQILGPDVQLLDSGGAIARQVKRVLEHNNSLAIEKKENVMIYTTGNMQIAQNLAQRILGEKDITVQEVRLTNDN